MKKIILFVASSLLACIVCLADDYSYLTIQATSGTESSASLSTLRKITFQGGAMVLTNKDGTTSSYTLTDLNKMYFSSTSTGITTIGNDSFDTVNAEIYTLSGMKLNTSHDALPKGVYIMKANGKTVKMLKK